MLRPYAVFLSVVAAGACAALSFIGCTAVAGSGGVLPFNLPPNPVITVDLDRGVAPLTVQFNSTLSTDDGQIVARLWDFGDGQTSQEISPRHTYASTGVFTVSLTLTDDLGSRATRTDTISVTDAPIARIDVDKTAAESAPAVFAFNGAASSDPDGSIVSYRWDFGDGSIEFAATVAHTFVSAGNFRVRLTVTDNTGVTNTAEILVQVGVTKPTIELRIPPPDRTNIVVSQDSPLFVQGVFGVGAGVPRTIVAGLDGDRDVCDGQSVTYQASTGAQLLRIVGHFDRVNAVAYSPNSATLLTASDDGEVRRVDASNGAPVGRFAMGSPVVAIDVAPSGTEFAVGLGNGLVEIHDITTGDLIKSYQSHTSSVRVLRYSPDGSELFSGGADRRAILWRVSDGTILRDFIHPLSVNGVAFNPVAPATVATACEDGLVRIFNTDGGNLVLSIAAHGAPVNAVAFSPDGSRLLSGGDDKLARAFEPLTGVEIRQFSGHTSDVTSVAFSVDGSRVFTGSADATVRVWNRADATQLSKSQPCASPIASIDVRPDGAEFAVAVAARNDFQLDTAPSNGNDLNLTIPQPLLLSEVPGTGDPVEPGTYFLWAEIDTDRTDPVRTYANPTISVTTPFTTTISAATPLVNAGAVDDFTVVAIPGQLRQIYDLGPLNAGDRLDLSFAEMPGFNRTVNPLSSYSLMIVDESAEIFAWFQRGLLLFDTSTRLVIGHNSVHYYLIMDGAQSVNVTITRQSNIDPRRTQRVFVRFDANEVVRVAGVAFPVVPLNAASFNQFFAASPNWGATETEVIKDVVMATLRTIYDGYDIEFFSSDDGPPTAPYTTMYISGNPALSGFTTGLFGLSDYIDPRNSTVSGTGVTFALEVGTTIENADFANPTTSVAQLATAIGRVAAHECGHLFGLRHTDDPTDLMQGSADPTVPRTLKAALVSASDQLGNLPSIAVQNAPQMLEESIGLAP